MLKLITSNIIKISFNILNSFCPSSLLRAKIFKLFGADIRKGVKIEKILLMHYDGFNLKNLVVKDKAFIGPGTIVDIKDMVIIENSVKIAPGCNISTHVDCGKENAISKLYPQRSEKVIIGSNTWVGLNSTILCGVTIGDNSVIGAYSLVTRNIPSRVLAFGIPAKVQRNLDI
jgi:acetyltransferase-like isoleucine patch superfamily enzyme